MRKSDQSPEERDSLDRRLALVKRVVLTVDMFLFAAVGYWLGYMAEG